MLCSTSDGALPRDLVFTLLVFVINSNHPVFTLDTPLEKAKSSLNTAHFIPLSAWLNKWSCKHDEVSLVDIDDIFHYVKFSQPRHPEVHHQIIP